MRHGADGPTRSLLHELKQIRTLVSLPESQLPIFISDNPL